MLSSVLPTSFRLVMELITMRQKLLDIPNLQLIKIMRQIKIIMRSAFLKVMELIKM
jgi:hypothetical protein